MPSLLHSRPAAQPIQRLEDRRLLAGFSSGDTGLANLGSASQMITVDVDADTTRQTIDGFGASINVWGSAEAYSDPAFFNDLVLDAGINMIRIPLYYSFENYNDNDDPYVMELGPNQFDIEAIRPMMEFTKELEKRADVQVLATVWSPPSWMKTNSESWFGGYLRPEMREEFAEYISAFVTIADQQFDVQIDAISLQNEPLFSEPYESAFVSPQAMARIMTTVDNRLERDGWNNVKLVASEDLNVGGRLNDWSRELDNYPGTADMDFIWGHHWGEFTKWGDVADADGRSVWWTEGSGKNSTNLENAIANSYEMATAFNHGRMSAFIDWQFDGDAHSSLYKNNQKRSRYASMKHYARWMQKGSVVLETNVFDGNGPLDGANYTEQHVAVSSYDPDQDSNSIVMTNTSSSDQFVTININGSNDRAPDTGGNGGADWLAFLTNTDVASEYARSMTVNIGNGVPDTYGVNVSPDGRTAWVRMPKKSLITLTNGASNPIDGTAQATASGRRNPTFGRGLGQNSYLNQSAIAGSVGGVQDHDTPEKFAWRWQDGRDVLHAAAAAVRWDVAGVVDYVISRAQQYGMDIDRADDSGMTPMMVAAANQQIVYNAPAEWAGTKIQKFIDAGAKVHAKDNLGRTGLHWAASIQQWSFSYQLPQLDYAVTTLLNNGADPNKVDTFGMTALDWAQSEGNSAAAAKISSWMNQANFDQVGPQTVDRDASSIYDFTWTFDEAVTAGTLSASDFVFVHEDGTTRTVEMDLSNLPAGNTQASLAAFAENLDLPKAGYWRLYLEPASGRIKDAAGNAWGGYANGDAEYIQFGFLPGDANLDGRVDLADFTSLRNNWNRQEVGNPADFNNSGRVDLYDFQVIRRNFGQTLGDAPTGTFGGRDNGSGGSALRFGGGDDRAGQPSPVLGGSINTTGKGAHLSIFGEARISDDDREVLD